MNEKKYKNIKNKPTNNNRRKPIFWWWFGGGLATLSLLVTAAFSFPQSNNTSSITSSVVSSSSSSLVNSSISSSLTPQVELLAIEVDKLPTKLNYLSTEVVTTLGGTLRVVYSDYSVKYVPMNDTMIETSRLNLSNVGNTTVTLRYEDKGNVKFITYPIKVIPFIVNPTKVSIDITSSDVLFNQQVDLNYLVEPVNASYSTVIWSSSNESIATVNQDGVVTPKNAGEVVITVMVDGKLQATSRLNVLVPEFVIGEVIEEDTEAPTLTNLSIQFESPTSLTVEADTDEEVTYYIFISNGPILNANSILAQSSNNLISDISTSLTISKNVTGISFINGYHLSLIAKDTANNMSNLLFIQLYNIPALLLVNDWLPIASPTELQRINNSVSASPGAPVVYGQGTNYAYNLTQSLTRSQSLAKNYFLVNNLDFSSVTVWTQIGDSGNPFSGSFDGQNHKIINHQIVTPLFGNINGGSITWTQNNSSYNGTYSRFFGNFDFVPAYTNNDSSTRIALSSPIINTARNVNIKNIKAYHANTDKIIYSSSSYALFETLDTTLLENVESRLNINTTSNASGIGKILLNSSLINVNNYGNIQSTISNSNASVSGIAYYTEGYIKILNSSNVGNIISNSTVGGIFATADRTSLTNIIIENTFNAGNITSTVAGGNTGGLIGFVRGGTVSISNSYNSGTIIARFQASVSGGLIGRYQPADDLYDPVYDKIKIVNSYNVGLIRNDLDSLDGGSIIGEINYRSGDSALASFATYSKAKAVFDNMIFENVLYKSENTSQKFIRQLNFSTFNEVDVANKFQAKTDTQMRALGTYSNFDLENIWIKTENNYPILRGLSFGLSNYVLNESLATDGTIQNNELIIIISNSSNTTNKFSQLVSKNDVTIRNLPIGLDFEVSLLNENAIKIIFTGVATSSINSSSINNLEIEVSKNAVSNLTANVIFKNISIIYYDITVSYDLLKMNVPSKGAVRQTSILSNRQISGTITWSPVPNPDNKFQASTAYTAVIDIITVPNSGYSLSGLASDFFKVLGSTSVNTIINSSTSATVTVVFPATAP